MRPAGPVLTRRSDAVRSSSHLFEKALEMPSIIVSASAFQHRGVGANFFGERREEASRPDSHIFSGLARTESMKNGPGVIETRTESFICQPGKERHLRSQDSF